MVGECVGAPFMRDRRFSNIQDCWSRCTPKLQQLFKAFTSWFKENIVMSEAAIWTLFAFGKSPVPTSVPLSQSSIGAVYVHIELAMRQNITGPIPTARHRSAYLHLAKWF